MFAVMQKAKAAKPLSIAFKRTVCPLVKNGLYKFLLTTKKAQQYWTFPHISVLSPY